MKIISTLAITVAIALASTSVHASTTVKEANEDVHRKVTVSPLAARLQSISDKLTAQDYPGARLLLNDVVADPAFADLPASVRHGILSTLAMTESMAGDQAAAYDHLVAAGPATGDATDQMYYGTMMGAAAATGHKDVATDAFLGLVRVAPTSAQYFEVGFVVQVEREARARDDKGATRKALLEALWTAHYRGPNMYLTPERAWFDLFEIYVADGETDKAHEVMTAFREPTTVIRLRADKRYAPFLVTYPKAGDFKASLEASLAEARALMLAHPRDLEGVSALAVRLADAGQLDESLKLADDALAKIAAAPKDKPVYDDQAEQLQWIHMTRATVMQRLGRTEDQVKTQEVARDSAAGSRDDVSQAINLGDEYYASGRPQDALDAVKNVDNHVSAYGQMAANEVRACAYKQLGDTAKLAETMAYMKAHSEDGYSPYRSALLCTGDADGMAANLIERLDNPVTRNETLTWMQGYLSEPSTEFYKQEEQVAKTACSRPEVQAAVAKYGNVEFYPMYKQVE